MTKHLSFRLRRWVGSRKRLQQLSWAGQTASA